MLKKYQRVIAAFLLVTFLTNIFAPTISWALTAGPTAPEATSFEPVDTTDMVNHITGDLAYNIPFLEVPGPSGGYPLSLSYHAGIQTNEDASWVGLGFSLNPGAINRNVSGLVDDFDNAAGSTHSFWEGGSSKSLQIGLNYSQRGQPSASVGLSYSEDTYQGFSAGFYANLDGTGRIQFSDNNGTVSREASMGIGKGLSMSWSDGVLASKSELPGKLSGLLNMDISLSSIKSAIKSSVGLPIKQTISNSKQGSVSVAGKNFTANIPLSHGFSLRLGKSYQRYWIDEKEITNQNGALYFPSVPSALPSSLDLDTKAYDVYDISYGPQEPAEGSTSSPDEYMAGSYIDYDNYQVVAQGISGNMRPFHYESYLLRQNKKTDLPQPYRVKSYPLRTNMKSNFRFVGDFSNRFIHNSDIDQFTPSGTSSLPLDFTFDPNRVTGEDRTDGYNQDTNILPGSNHVSWYTNSAIFSGDARANNFLDCSALGFTRANNNLIGGFKVINSSGVAYHYALPVLSFDERQYSGRIDEQGKHWFNVYNKPGAYASSWLLTSVTGPDYVDRNSNGKADSGDFGYWVNFEYGQWSNEFDWRNPSEGFNKDVEQQFEIFSKGKKQVYYLNAIKTQTHTALFVKGFRYDGKSVVPKFESAALTGPGHVFREVDEGGFDPIERVRGGITSTEYPSSTLKLSRVYLLKNEDFSDLGNLVSTVSQYGADAPPDPHMPWAADRSSYVIDDSDLAGEPFKTRLKQKAIRIIELKTDYSLCPGTANSYITPADAEKTGATASEARLGKLTLKALKIYGANEEEPLIPETKFNYDVDYPFQGTVTKRDDEIYLSVNLASHSFKRGEIITHMINDNLFYAYVSDILLGTNEIQIRQIFGDWDNLKEGSSRTFMKTKNPPYEKDAYDLWGLYKVDFDHFSPTSISAPSTNPVVSVSNDWRFRIAGLFRGKKYKRKVATVVDQAILNDLQDDVAFEESDNIRRMTTSTSATATDVWSLREITMPTGSKIRIEYEPDQYKTAIKSLSNIPIKDVERLPNGTTKLILYENPAEFGLHTGSVIKFRALTSIRFIVNELSAINYRFDCGGTKLPYTYKWYYNNLSAISIQSANANSVTINTGLLDANIGMSPSECLHATCPDPEDISCYGGDNTSSAQGLCIPMNYLTAQAPIFLGGEIILQSGNVSSTFGGDLRVAKVSVENFSETRSTLFEYSNGVTTYEPVGIQVPVRRLTNLTSCLRSMEQSKVNAFRTDHANDVYARFMFLFANARELPGPGVQYGLVKVREQIERHGEVPLVLPGSTEYQFEVFSPQTVEGTGTDVALVNQFRSQVTFGTPTGTPSGQTVPVLDLNVTSIKGKSVATIEDFSAIMGSLKRITLYDAQGRKVSETINEYLHDKTVNVVDHHFNSSMFRSTLANENGYKNQGVITETFAEARIIINPASTPTSYSLYPLISRKIKYPNIQTGQTVIDYKTGIKTQSSNLEFDFYSGQTTKTQFTDGYGNKYQTAVTPAYKVYPSMKAAALGGKNMLTQEALSYAYKINSSNQKTGLVSAAAQTWSDQIPVLTEGKQVGIWRKRANYSFIGDNDAELNGDGLHPLSGNVLPPFSAWSETTEPGSEWSKNSAITLYDVQSHALEATDINGNNVATKMSYDNAVALVTGANAAYREIAYSGAEETPRLDQFGLQAFGGGVYFSGTGFTNNAHTGVKAVVAGSGGRGFTYFMVPKERTYHVSVWSSMPNAVIYYKLDSNSAASVPTTNTGQAGGWYLMEADIDITGTHDNLEIWCQAGGSSTNFDDFRVHPVDASITSYVYNGRGQLTHILDNNNLYTEYKYDIMGRLQETYMESLNRNNPVKISEAIYHYQNTQN